MNKKLQVFISSTYSDLIDERQAAVLAVLVIVNVHTKDRDIKTVVLTDLI